MAQSDALIPVKPSAPRSRSPGATTRRPKVRHGLDVDGRALHVGTQAVDLHEVAAYKARGLAEKDLSTSFATMAIFSIVAGVMVFGVVETGWRARFLLEGLLFGSIAVCAFAELFSARRNTLFTFELDLASGQRHTFVTADRDDAMAVKAILDAAGAKVR